ncbi:MAG TPA: alpha/beta-type small acid-soluble spore protein [Pseudobacteroides sp.]|nr:alpha/beta-type small acid-soluble spore protein [Pseudobacteroides sp.]
MPNNNHKVVPQSANALEKMKYEIASQVGVSLKNGYNGDLTARDAGKIGGNITKKLIEIAENQLANK